MSLYTHWVCFLCRTSFHNPPLSKYAVRGIEARRCPKCGEEMFDMGVYFEPPPKRAKRSWEIVKLLAEGGFKFQTEGDVAYIRTYILDSKRPRLVEVRRNIETAKRETEEAKGRVRLRSYKEKKKRKVA